MAVGTAAAALAPCALAQQVGEHRDLPPEMMNSAVGTRATRLAKTIPYIQCEVCHLVVAEMWTYTNRAAEKAPYGAIGEMELHNIVRDTCDPQDDLGEWMTMYDLKQNGTGKPVTVEKQEYVGECRRECSTIEHICRTVVDEHADDMAELLFKHFKKARDNSAKKDQDKELTQEKFLSRVCKKWSKKCPSKPVPEKFKHKDEYWMPGDPESLKMKRMQHQLNKAASESGAQPVQFLDPMGMNSMMRDGMDDEF